MSQYTLREIKQFTRPDPELEPLFQADADYAEYQACASQSEARLPRLSWTVYVVTAQGVSGLVEFPRPSVEPPEFLVEAGGGATQGLHRKSVRMPTQQASSAGSREEPPSKRQRHSLGIEEEPIAIFDETEEPTDIDLEDTSGSTMPRATGTQEVACSEANEEVSEEDEEGGEDRDGDED
ncbi:hypothetical protein RHMOL_Rhmol06G0137900 [Rhododendron molle]|uniref:Uncharacterized protein n=1 Tax=Rhododendron molle TaxID=49168 RepID=A0ACC0NE14_RHOML|nr:hypothetical protein RHMOL_Rhmol06G0137900 [Rhododendron molle]